MLDLDVIVLFQIDIDSGNRVMSNRLITNPMAGACHLKCSPSQTKCAYVLKKILKTSIFIVKNEI